MGALVGVYRLQVHHMADHMVLVADTVATVHVTGLAGDIDGLAAVVAFHQRHHFRRPVAGIHQSAQL